MAAQKFGGRMHHDVSTVRQRFEQPGRRKSGIDHQRNTRLMCNRAHGGDVQHIQAGVAHGFAKQQARIGANRGAPGIQVVGGNKSGLNAKTRERVRQQVLRASVQRAAGHNVRACAHERGNRQMQGGLPARGGQCGDTTIERCHALLEHGSGGVADARIHMTAALHVEKRRRMVARIKHERRGQIKRNGARARGGVGGSACVQRKRVKAGVSVTGHMFLQAKGRGEPLGGSCIVGYISLHIVRPLAFRRHHESQ